MTMKSLPLKNNFASKCFKWTRNATWNQVQLRDLEYFQVYRQQDNVMFGNLFYEIELRDGVVF